jgi:hypothetical protein
MPRVHILFALCTALAAGCAPPPLPPEAQCFAAATAQYRGPWREARRIEAELARGYAIERTRATRLAPISCHEGGRRGTCFAEHRETSLRRVPINLEWHRARLAALEARMAALRPAAMAAAAPCGYGARAALPPPR